MRRDVQALFFTVATSRAGELFFEISRYRTRCKSQNRSRTFLSACEGFASSVIATVKPAPVQRRVPYTFADVPLNAGRLVVSQVARTARQERQRRSQERGFDDGEHARDPLFISFPILAFAAGTKARKKGIPHAHRRWMTTIHRRQAKTWPNRSAAASRLQPADHANDGVHCA